MERNHDSQYMHRTWKQCCSFIHEPGEESCALPWAPEVLNILCCPGGITALPKGRMFCAGCSVFGFATVLFQLIKLSLLQNVNANQEARGAFLQEMSEFFVLNEAVSIRSLWETFFSRVLYNLVALALSWEWNALFDCLSGLPWLNVHFLITVLSIPFKWDSLENSWCSTFTLKKTKLKYSARMKNRQMKTIL